MLWINREFQRYLHPLQHLCLQQPFRTDQRRHGWHDVQLRLRQHRNTKERKGQGRPQPDRNFMACARLNERKSEERYPATQRQLLSHTAQGESFQPRRLHRQRPEPIHRHFVVAEHLRR